MGSDDKKASEYPKTVAGMLQPGFQIGGYILRDGMGGYDKVWIETGHGEGGDFPAAELEKLIADFYAEWF